MSLETRSSSALFKRAEQLKRWEESDTNRESINPKQKPQKVKFSSGCVFLAACAAGDKEEVLRLIEKGADIDTANVDGLTALHQACIDDNLDMVEFLVEHGSDVNRGDNEGWTPLHATASCGFLSIAKYLLEHGANVAAVNNDGELAVDIAECEDMEDLLQTELDEQGIDCDAARSEEERLMLNDAKEWLSGNNLKVNSMHPKSGATALHVAASKGYIDVINTLIKCGADVDKQDADGWTPLHAAAHWGQKESAQILADNFVDMDAKNCVGQTAFDVADLDMFRYLEDLQKRQNKEEVLIKRQSKKRSDILADIDTPTKIKKVEIDLEEKEKEILEIEKNNRVNSISNNEVITSNNTEAVKVQLTQPPSVPPKPLIDSNTDENLPSWRRPVSRQKAEPNKTSSFRERSTSSDITNEDDVILRRTNSFKNDPENLGKENSIDNINISSTTSSVTTSSSNSPTPATSPLPGNQPVRRSFVPPVRDEESETQRKAHAKRVRETRRSTQGVTLEEIKSAEQLVKKKNQTGPNNNNTNIAGTEQSKEESSNGISVTATITTATPTVPTREIEEPALIQQERRPSWRLRVDNGSKFKLEDATKDVELPSTPSFLRRPGTITNQSSRPASTPVENCTEATITIPRRPKSLDNKEQDKENDARNAQSTLATQAAIQRRRRPKRRSTGVVAFDNLDDPDAEKDSSVVIHGEFEDSSKLNHHESGTDKSSNRSSRLGSTSDIRGENGEIDYKKLYEQAIVENDRLKDKLRKSDEELRDTKQTLEKLNTVTSKNSLSELEKREKRAMERKLSEMEEELKQLQKLKAENERLRAENRALTRVVSKLTNSASK